MVCASRGGGRGSGEGEEVTGIAVRGTGSPLPRDLPRKGVKMSLQSVFDTAAKRLVAQGRPARNGRLSCMYRTDSGEVCAVGALMTEEELEVLGEIGLLKAPLHRLPEEVKDRLLEEVGFKVKFLESLQGAHDRSQEGAGWLGEFKYRMRELAQEYRLHTDCLGELE